MRLLNIETCELVETSGSVAPTYAILSHTWSALDRPIVNQWVVDGKLRRYPLYEKVIEACKHAAQRGVIHLWVDYLCVDTSSTVEMEEAVNSSWRRLFEASICFVYLVDLPAEGPPFAIDTWKQCKYWTRAWTLQELVIPSKVEFFDIEWNSRGSKASPTLLPLLSTITGISERILLDNNTIFDTALAVRLSWNADRIATRGEDVAYSLVALTGVSMQLRYGEGAERAFTRLQEEILHDTADGSIFAWRSSNDECIRGLLARCPSEFRHFSAAAESGPWIFDGRVQSTNRGIRIHSRICHRGLEAVLAIGRPKKDHTCRDSFGIYLREWDGIYFRIRASSETRISDTLPSQCIDVSRGMCLTSGTKFNAFPDDTHHIITTAGETPYEDCTGHESTQKQDAMRPTSQVEPKYTRSKEAMNVLALRPAQRLGSFAKRSPECGLKRDRAGRPKSLFQDQEEYGEWGKFQRWTSDSSPCSRSESEDLEDEGLDDEDRDSWSEDNAVADSSLTADLEFQQNKSGLLQCAYEKAMSWLASARYVAPPDNRLPPRKRARTSEWQPSSACLEEEIDEDDQQLVVVSRLDGYFHLACPFYVSNPERYQQCLRQHDLQSIEEVISHVRQHHMKPPYCPICYQEFYLPRDRDSHINARTCERRSSGTVDGLNEHGRIQLLGQDKMYLGERARWLRIWALIRPNAEQPGSPYLDSGVGRDVSAIRDYWRSHGLYCVSNYLSSHKLLRWHRSDDDATLHAVCKLVLEDMLEKLLEEHRRAG